MKTAKRGKMDLLDYQRHLFEYDHWANRTTFASLRALPMAPPRAVKILGHIIGAEWLWLNRLRQEKQVMAVWPDIPLDRCEVELGGLERPWGEYLRALEPNLLASAVPYVNTKGEAYTTPVRDILMHVVMHSAYHRGQIASEIRAAGGSPAYTDYVHAVRQGLV
ncbi:MAG: DinB family protein [Gemmatimonadetes bacterium]|nr:DinB family protein [Gemmatimonadota bacterium]